MLKKKKKSYGGHEPDLYANSLEREEKYFIIMHNTLSAARKSKSEKHKYTY